MVHSNSIPFKAIKWIASFNYNGKMSWWRTVKNRNQKYFPFTTATIEILFFDSLAPSAERSLDKVHPSLSVSEFLWNEIISRKIVKMELIDSIAFVRELVFIHMKTFTDWNFWWQFTSIIIERIYTAVHTHYQRVRRLRYQLI